MLQYLIINSYSNMKCILFISNSALYFACGKRNSYCNLFITIHSGWKISWHFLKAFLFLVNEYNAFTNHKTNPNNTRGNAAWKFCSDNMLGFTLHTTNWVVQYDCRDARKSDYIEGLASRGVPCPRDRLK
jgi:hypothetical protein